MLQNTLLKWKHACRNKQINSISPLIYIRMPYEHPFKCDYMKP